MGKKYKLYLNNIRLKYFSGLLETFQSSPMYGRTIAVSVVFFLIIKQILVNYTFGEQFRETHTIDTIFNYLLFFANDFMVLGIILFFVFINIISKSKILKLFLNSFNIILFLLFIVDLFTIYFFQSRLSIFELYDFLDPSSSLLVLPYISLIIAGFAVFFIIIFIVTQKYFKFKKHKILTLSIAVFIFSIMFTIVSFYPYKSLRLQENILNLNLKSFNEYVLGKENITTTKPKINYEDYFQTIKGENKKLNLILIFAESFSATDSKRVGGLTDNFPYFDKIQADGITFKNAIANGCTSDTAHISLLQGVEPRYIPNDKQTNKYFKYKGYTESLPEFFNNIGYNTLFLSTVSLNFLNQRTFLSGLHFKNIIGDEAFSEDKKYVFNAAPDYDLYNKALDIVQSQKSPYFLTLQTISSHIPYNTPYGSSSEQMLKYVDKNIYAFYQKLKRSGFFNNGILVIIGDHRKMEPLKDGEVDKFGKIAYAKILATIVGSGINPNTFNSNIVQHTDFFNSIKYIFGGEDVKISSIYNNVFTNQTNRNRGAAYCRYFDNKYGVVTKDGIFYSFKNNLDVLSGSDFSNYLNAYEKFQEGNITGDSISNTNSNQNIINNQSKAIIIGHRGSSSMSLENSLESFQIAKRNGADGVEFDISLTKDDKNIVMHGPSLSTTTCGSSKLISNYTLDYIKKNCKLHNGEEVRTFEEMLKEIKGLFKYYFVEIKVTNPSKAEQQTLDAIKSINNQGMADNIIFTSYDKIANYLIGSLKSINAARDGGFDTGGIDILPSFSHEYYMLYKDNINQEVLNQIENMNKKFIVYTVNDSEEFKKLYGRGIRIFMTDDILGIKRALNEIEKQK